jgi:ribosomal protein S18 acetylase RimI-like enzyme
MQILRAKPDDAPLLTEIAFASKRHWGYPERWMANWASVLTIEPRLIAEQETHTASIEGEVVVGFYSLRAGLGRSSLEHLWVVPNSMGRGVGRALFEHAVDRARELGHRVLEIESDPNAAGFYQRMGARRVGTRITTLDGRPRELPFFTYGLARKMSGLDGQPLLEDPGH